VGSSPFTLRATFTFATFGFTFLDAVRWPGIVFASIAIRPTFTGPSLRVPGRFSVNVRLVIRHNAMSNTREAITLGLLNAWVTQCKLLASEAS
jgi:hypothetical protein